MPWTVLLAAALCAALLLCACRGSVEALTGDYEAERVDGPPARLELRPDGGGLLATGSEEAAFRWEVKADGQVMLHLRMGGVVPVRQGSGQLETDIPGVGRLTFRKKEK